MIKRLFWILALMMMGCGGNDEDYLETGSYALIHGEEASDEEFGAVVAIGARTDDGFRAYCTGVLIEEDVVLTAAHCVSETPDMPFNQLYENNRLAVITSQDASHPDADHIFALKEVHVHFLFHLERSVHDLALIRLDRPVPETMAKPIAYAPYNEEMRQKMYNHGRVTFVGYGVDEQNMDNRRLYYEGQIYDYCPMVGNPEDCYRKDPNGNPLLMPVGTLLFDLEKGGPCAGDSGGPVLTDFNDTQYVIGIVSFGDAGCSIYNVSSAIPDHSGWIEETLHPKPKKDSCSAIPLSNPRQSPWSIGLLFLCVLVIGIQKNYDRMPKL